MLTSKRRESPIQPANFVLPAGEPGGVKLGHDSHHLFTTIMTGVGGDTMTAFQEQLTSDQIWTIVHFVQSLRVTAHETTLLGNGLQPKSLESARRRIWGELSLSAKKGKIDETVVESHAAFKASQPAQAVDVPEPKGR